MKNTCDESRRMENRPIRVLHILNKLDTGGAENFLMNIFRNIDRENWVFDFLVHGKGAYDEEVKRMGGKIFYFKGYVNEVGINKYRKRLREFLLGKGSEYKIIHSHVDQTSGLFLPAIKKYTRAICISHSHSLSNYNNGIIKLYKKWLQYQLNRYADYRFACSQKAGKWLFGRNKFFIIPNGIDVEKFKFKSEERIQIRNQLGISENDFVIGHVGRFESVKNHMFLVEVFAQYNKRVKESKLLLIGNGSLKGDVENRIHTLNLDNFITILDAQKDINRYYNAMDVFVFPSFLEGFGIVAVEAQANGLRVLASTGVSIEAKVSDRIEFLPLVSKEEWVCRIEDARKNRISREAGIESEYEIVQSAHKLIEWYESIIYN